MQASSQKHLLCVTLDRKLIFDKHLNNVLNKVNKTIRLLRKLQYLLPRSTLITLHKSFDRPHLDYGDILYDQTNGSSFHEKLESIQYNACLAIRSSLKEKIYQELGFESLRVRRSYRRVSLFYKVLIMGILNIFSSWFLPDVRCAQRETHSPFLSLIKIFKIGFFYLLSSNETN